MALGQIMTQIGAIDPTVLLLIIQLAIAFFILYSIQKIARNLLMYLSFKFNERIAIGTQVKIGERIYRVNKINILKVELENEEGYLQIPISRWTYTNMVVLKYKNINYDEN